MELENQLVLKYLIIMGCICLSLIKMVIHSNYSGVLQYRDNFSDFKRRKGAKEAIGFCANSNSKLIRILQPKNILLLGNHAAKYLSPYFDKAMEDILRTRNDKTALIRKTAIAGIPTYWMCHPSSRQGFWSGENLIMKRGIIEAIF